jgi:hypothetical protein
MAALSDEAGTLKFVHTYGVGLHSGDADPDVHDPRWQQRQVEDFVEFTVLAEDLGFDGVTLTEHHAPLMTCPSPHLLLAAAAMKTSRIRLGTAVTVLPLYSPLRVAEEASRPARCRTRCPCGWAGGAWTRCGSPPRAAGT